MSDELLKRVEKFNLLQLPGQPMGMHMGTSYLINDLAARVRELEAERDALRALLREAIALRVKLFRHSDPFGDTDKESDEKVAMRDPYAAKWNAALKDSP